MNCHFDFCILIFDFPMIGNEKSVNFLGKCIEKEKISQAYLFSGPEGVGKFALAKKFAQSLITKENFSENIELEKIPLDLIIIEPEIEKGKEKDIKIEQIRDVQKDLALFPYEGRCKVLIINNAHKMNDSSQNALLKILEEPNATSIIILITSEEGKILPTIKSRCQKINFSLVDPEIIEKGLKENDFSSNEKDLISFSMGRPGFAINMVLNPEEYKEKKEYFEKLSQIFRGGTNLKMEAADEISEDTTKAIKVLEFWIWILRIKNSDSFKNKVKKVKIIEQIEEALEMIKNTNANVKLVLENLLINF